MNIDWKRAVRNYPPKTEIRSFQNFFQTQYHKKETVGGWNAK